MPRRPTKQRGLTWEPGSIARLSARRNALQECAAEETPSAAIVINLGQGVLRVHEEDAAEARG
jgi:hypothetical protein